MLTIKKLDNPIKGEVEEDIGTTAPTKMLLQEKDKEVIIKGLKSLSVPTAQAFDNLIVKDY